MTCSIDIRLKRTSKEFAEGVNIKMSYLKAKKRHKSKRIKFFKTILKDIIAGDIIINSSTPAVHSGIYLTLDGMVNINLSTKNVGVFEAFYNSAKVTNKLKKIEFRFLNNLSFSFQIQKPIQLINYSMEISKAGKFPANKTEIPFEIPLRTKSTSKYLYETYHGVFINIQVSWKMFLLFSVFSIHAL